MALDVDPYLEEYVPNFLQGAARRTYEVYDGHTDPARSMWWTAMAWYNKLYRAGRANGSFDMAPVKFHFFRISRPCRPIL